MSELKQQLIKLADVKELEAEIARLKDKYESKYLGRP